MEADSGPPEDPLFEDMKILGSLKARILFVLEPENERIRNRPDSEGAKMDPKRDP